MASRPGILRRFFGGLWWLLDSTRRLVMNLLFLALVILVATLWWFGRGGIVVKDNTALVLNLSGELVEQFTGSTTDLLLAETVGDLRRQTRLRDVVRAVDAAATDARITRIVLVLDDLSGGGVASLREIGAALGRFKAAGKPVVAWGSTYTQRQYLLAAHADEVYLHPYGTVALTGIGGNSLYFKDALDKLGVTMHAFQAGKYKSAVEPFTRNQPSPESLEADLAWLRSLWGSWSVQVETARKLAPGSIDRMIDEMPQRLAAVEGDPAQLALREKLVDGLRTRDEFRAQIGEQGAPESEDKGTFRQIGYGAYLSAVAPARGEQIAVVVAQGAIVDGEGPTGMVGGRETAELIRRARTDAAIKALVLRVDSPGGSVFGSELIRREVELMRAAGKPVVASMGDMAASGGYWITMGADEVLADAGTVTGSIGVFGVLPTFDKALDKLGVGVGGPSTHWLAGASSPLTPMDPRYAQVLQARVGHYYQEFITLAAKARNTTPAQINEVAQGRVWTGQQAHEHRLVDQLGGLHDALQRAAALAKISGEFRPVYLERGPRGLERWLSLFMGRVAVVLDQQFGSQLRLQWLAGWPWRVLEPDAGALWPALQVFAGAREQPLRAYAYCFCAGVRR